jgi:hypothetical protein
MPDPERLRKTIERAVEAIRQQPGRRGRFIDLRDADEVLVAGDLHGHLANFQAIYQAADLAKHPRRHLILQEVVHGKFRYPLGGDKSHQLLDLFSALKNQFPARVHLLLGNHELSQWTDRPIIKGEEDLNMLFVNGLQEAYGDKASTVYASYRQLFAVLPLAIRTANRIFISHSLPAEKYRDGLTLTLLEQEDHPPEDYSPKGSVYSLLWGRDCSAANAAAFLRNVECDWLVSGHIPCEHGFATPNEQQIILDSCTSPAAYALLPANRPLTRNEFYATVFLL